jgi:transposase
MRKGIVHRASVTRAEQITGQKVVVGLDVHKRSIVAAIRVNGEEVKHCTMPADPEVVVRTLEPYRAGMRMVVYEAGLTGYGLARALEGAGMPAVVVAPSRTPRSSTAQSKSDRLDCGKLALFAEKGELLKAVVIPTEQEEHDRQLIRTRQQLVDQRRRIKQQIKSLLTCYGIVEPPGLAYWSCAAVQELRSMKLSRPLRACLDALMHLLQAVSQELDRLNEQIARISRQARHRQAMSLLQSHPGVGGTTATNFLVEVYRPERFANEKQLAAYVGLAPRVKQSGETRHAGPLMKAGRGHLRAMLVEAAWSWIRRDEQAKAVYRHLLHATGSAGKAIVAMARRLAIRLWRMLLRREPYRATCPA